jgi:hypothetical protein
MCEKADFSKMASFVIKKDECCNKKAYAIFYDEGLLYDFHQAFPMVFAGCSVVCFGGYSNAFEIGTLH